MDADSGVPNYDQGDGCTFLDEVWAEAPFANHGTFVETVEAMAEAGHELDLLTGHEAGQVIAAAALRTSAPTTLPI